MKLDAFILCENCYIREHITMRTYDFKMYQEFSHGNFLPTQTIESEEFGRHFFIDANFELL